MRYEVWSEGYHAQGNSGKATCHGAIEASSFRAACKALLGDTMYYDEAKNTFWGCRLFDNEHDARRAFG